MGGDKVDDYILFSVPIRDLFVSSKKQDLVDSTQTVGDNQSEIKTSQVKKMKKTVLMLLRRIVTTWLTSSATSSTWTTAELFLEMFQILLRAKFSMKKYARMFLGRNLWISLMKCVKTSQATAKRCQGGMLYCS